MIWASAMSQRFFVATPLRVGQTVQLDGPEGRHMVQVMRCQVGDTVTLFDGLGAEFPSRVVGITRRVVELEPLERIEANRESSCRLAIGAALPKGERQRWLVEKAVELGVAELVPLITTRGVARVTDNTLERLRRGVIEASKQCGRNRLMTISSPATWAEFLASGQEDEVAGVAHPADNQAAALSDWAGLAAAAGAARIGVGAEGGLTDDEIAAARQGDWRLVDLGPRILRVETAVAAIAACISATR